MCFREEVRMGVMGIRARDFSWVCRLMSFFSKRGIREVSFSYRVKKPHSSKFGYLFLELGDQVADCEIQFCIPLFILTGLTVLNINSLKRGGEGRGL